MSTKHVKTLCQINDGARATVYQIAIPSDSEVAI